MNSVAHIWVARAKCSCGYIWTNPGSPNVVCACGKIRIANDVPSDSEPITDEAEFKQAVADCISADVNELILIHEE